MFAGIHQIILDEEQSQVMGIASKEGEEVGGCCEIYSSSLVYLIVSSLFCNILHTVVRH